jgi:hypothetical protein
VIGDASRRAETQRRIDEEIRREKAAALGRAGERLDEALREVDELGRRLDALGSTADARARTRLLDEYERAWQRAQTARHALVIQREAIGLRTHRTVDQLFPERPRRRRNAP